MIVMCLMLVLTMCWYLIALQLKFRQVTLARGGRIRKKLIAMHVLRMKSILKKSENLR